MESLNFAQLLRRHLDARKLLVTDAADLWHVHRKTLSVILAGKVSVPETKVGFWAQVLEMPEEEVLAAVNRTRAHLGREPLTPPRDTTIDGIGIPCHTVEQAQAAIEQLQATNAPAAEGEDGATAEAACAGHGADPAAGGVA